MHTTHRLILLAALALAAPAHALFDDEEARNRIEQLRKDNDARFLKLEATTRGQIELANQIESLRADIARLRGQIEVLTNEMEQTQKRQRDFYVDLDARLRKLETAAIEARTPPKPDPAAEARDYENALTLFKAAKYKEAASALEDFAAKYPDSSFQPNAHYWLGSALLQTRDYGRASASFEKVASTWPEDPKAPDALLGLASVKQETGDPKGARGTLEAIVAKYPASQAAQLAKDRLKPTRKR